MRLYKISATASQTDVFSMFYDGTYAYINSNAQHNVQAYTIDVNNHGALSAIPGATIDIGDDSWHIWGNGDYLFVPSFNGQLSAYSFDGSTFTIEGKVAKTDPATEMRGCWGDQNYVYFGTDNYFAAYTFDGSDFTYVTSSHAPTAVGLVDHIQADRQGKIYVAGSDAFGIYAIEGGNFRCYSRTVKVAPTASYERVSIDEYLHGDSGKQYIYVTMGEYGLRAFEMSGTSAISLTIKDNINGTEFADAIVGDGHGVWIGGSNLKLRYYTFDGSIFNQVYEDTAAPVHGFNFYEVNGITYYLNVEGIQTWIFDASVYVDLGAISIGRGISSSPYNINQFFNYNNGGQSISAGISAIGGDNFYLKGIGISEDGTRYSARVGGFNYLPWEDGAPYKLSATDPNASIMFGVYGHGTVGDPVLSAIHHVKVENAIINILDLFPGDLIVPPSGTYTFNNCIVYNDFIGKKVKNWNISVNGSSIINSECRFYEYFEDIPTCACNNKIYFNDSLFIDSYVSDAGFNYGLFEFNYCLFNNSITEVSARLSSTYNGGGTVEFNNCTFNWTPTTDLATFNETVINTKYDSSLRNITYGIPDTSEIRLSAWETGGYDTGFWNSTRTGPGAFYFLSTGKGHIGAFYFGPVNANIYTIPINIIGSIVDPNIIIIDTINTIVYPDVVNAFLTVNQPQVYSLVNIAVDFVGVPRKGSSPLMVDFTSTVRATGIYSGKYKVLEYKWYFDYGRDTSTYESTTSPNITHIFTGYAGKTYDIKCVAIIQLL